MSSAGRQRVLHVTSACTVGGAEAHVLALLGRLARECYEPWLAYFVERPDDARPMADDFRALGVRTVDLRGRGQIDPAATLRLAGLLRRERFAIVHAHSLRAELACVAAARLTKPRPKLVRSVHNTDGFYRRPPASWLARTSGQQLDAVIAISDAVADYLRQHSSIPPHRLRRIYYGLDVTPYRNVAPLSASPTAGAGSNGAAEAPWRERPGPTIGMIARLAPQKGHRVLIDALSRVVERLPEVRVQVVGHEHLTTTAELEAHARDRGVADHLEFRGFRDDLPELFAAWDLLVLPSLWEGFGLVLLEAMAAGRPVVASRVGPIPEIVVDGETGLLVRPNDPAALADALLEVLADPALGARFGASGRRRVAESFSLDQMVAETEVLYAELLSARAGGRVVAA